MGYESKLYIVEKSTKMKDESKRYAQKIAIFDMCKMYPVTRVFETETDAYFYADDGNTKVLEDAYGDALTEASIEDVIAAIEEVIAEGENYRRFFPLLAALKVIAEQKKNGIWKDIAVLHYGY